MSKKLGAQFLARMEAAKEGKRTAVEDKSPPKNPKKIKICIDLTAKPETAEDYLNKVLGTSSKQDRLFEFLKFRKNCPKLLPEVHLELDQLVQQGLQVENVDFRVPQLNPPGSEPLLPALGNKLGQSLVRILAPPVTECLLCDRLLTKHHPPVQVSLLGLKGPCLASKYAWRCRSCPELTGSGFCPTFLSTITSLFCFFLKVNFTFHNNR